MISGREEREKWAENIYEDTITENFPNLGMQTDMETGPESTESPNQYQPNEVHSKTHCS